MTRYSALPAEPATRRPAGSAVQSVWSLGAPLLTATILMIAWWARTSLQETPIVVFPSPQAVLAALREGWPDLLHHLRVTAIEAVSGYLAAAGGGVALASALSAARALRRGVLPLLFAADAVPKIALAPQIIVWFGWGYGSKIAMASLMCVLPIVISASAGLSRMPSELVSLARSYGASRWRTYRKVRFPHALPAMFVGLKLAVPLAVTGAVVGEFFVAAEGLGYAIRVAVTDTPRVFAAIALLAALTSVMLAAVVVAERMIVPWARHTYK